MQLKTSNNIGCAILAGGKNSRMGGRNKALIEIAGMPIIQRTINLMKDLFEEILLVTNSPGDFAEYGREATIITDVVKGVGPLGGIHSALSYTTKEAVFFIACDMPMVHNALIKQQINFFNSSKCDVLVPRVGSYIEPLHAIYSSSIKENITSFVKESSNYAVKSFLKTVNKKYVDVENNEMFANINTPVDLEKIKEI